MAGNPPSDADSEGTPSGDGPGGDAPASTFRSRLSDTFLKPPKPRPAKPVTPRPVATTDAEKKRLINQLDPTERKIGYLGAALAAAIALVINVAGVINPTHHLVTKTLTPLHGKVCPTGFRLVRSGSHVSCTGLGTYPRSHWLFSMGIALVFAAALYVVTRLNRRAALAFTAVFTGLALETMVGLLALPYIAAGGWLAVRAWRTQKYGSPTAKGPPKDADGKPVARPARAPATSGAGGRRGKKDAAPPTDATGRAKPEPNKRYTPKSPQRKRVQPPR
jgi:hypothetical protein